MQYKTRYKHPYIPSTSRMQEQDNKQINKLLNKKSLTYTALFIRLSYNEFVWDIIDENWTENRMNNSVIFWKKNKLYNNKTK